MADNLSQLLATPLQPLREQWRSAEQAELLRTARARHAESPDAYWAWVAERQRWTAAVGHGRGPASSATSATSPAARSTWPTTAWTAGRRTRPRPAAPP